MYIISIHVKNAETGNEDFGLTSKVRYVKRVLELGKVYAHV